MKKLVGLFLAVVMLLSVLAGCASETKTDAANDAAATPATSTTDTAADSTETPAEPAKTSGWKIGVCTPNNAVPFFARLDAGLEDAAAELGCTVEVQDANDDTATQINQVQTFIAQGVDLIILMPTQLESLIPVCKEANEAGIPIMTVNRQLTSESSADAVGVDLVTYVGADDYEGGKKQGELLVKLIGTSCNVLLMQGTLGASSCVYRQKGLEDYLAENAPDIKIVAMQPSDQEQAQAQTVMDNWLTMYAEGEIDAIVTQDPYSSIGCVDAMKAAGRTDLICKIITFDLPSEVLDAIRANEVYGTVVQAPYDQGLLGMQTAVKYLTEGGDNIDDFTYTDLPLCYIDNVSEFDTPAW